MIAIACLFKFKKKFEIFVILSLTLLSMSGLLCSYDSIQTLFFYMGTSKYQHDMEYMRADEFKSVVRGVGNVFLANFHWIFAL